jgi:5S rRNA maturation endonuclease (ribonuclease M5)
MDLLLKSYFPFANDSTNSKFKANNPVIINGNGFCCCIVDSLITITYDDDGSKIFLAPDANGEIIINKLTFTLPSKEEIISDLDTYNSKIGLADRKSIELSGKLDNLKISLISDQDKWTASIFEKYQKRLKNY